MYWMPEITSAKGLPKEGVPLEQKKKKGKKNFLVVVTLSITWTLCMRERGSKGQATRYDYGLRIPVTTT